VSALLAFAIGLTRSWVAVYTRGLPRDLRAERREEIDCDLWHQQRLAELERQPYGGTAASVFLRLILGVPEDILWRVEAGSAISERRTSVNDTPLMRIGFLAAVLPLAIFIFFGVSFMLGNGDWENSFEHWLWRAGFIALPAIGGAGLWLCSSRPKVGLALAAIGVGASAFLMPWMAFVTVPIGIVIMLFAALRAGVGLPSSRPRAA
jgi:hypothetical protein